MKGLDVDGDSWDYARSKVSGPAIALIVVCSISIGILLLALAFDAWLLLSGTAGKLAQPRQMSKDTAIGIRIAWSILILVTNVVILAGAVGMKGLKSHLFSRTVCILALIPCCGPCFVLGIPFGIWGLIVLNDPHVRAAFET